VTHYIILRDSPLGWFALLADSDGICRVSFGHASRSAAASAIKQDSDVASRIIECGKSFPAPPLLERAADLIDRYLSGEPVDLTTIPLSEPSGTPFQKKVRAALRRVGYGETISYGTLAKRAGRTGAARAVGTVMSTNKLPLLIPCHRVLAANNRLGGFSAPQGVDMKRRLLEMEGAETRPSV